MCKISFVVTCYNLEKYIEKCLKSILNQSLKEIEIIVVDDGSTDQTIDIVKNICENDARVKIVTQKNEGANAARKAGLKLATGEYVSFIDGDDWIDKDMAMEVYLEASNAKCDIAMFNYVLAYDDENKNKVCYDNFHENIQDNKYLELLLKQKISHNLWNRLYKRSLLLESDFYNVCSTSMGEDLAANILIALKKPRVKMIKKAYYYYYQRSNSTMNTVTKTLLEIVDSLNYIDELLKKDNLYEKYKKEIEYLWFIQCYYFNVILANVKHNKYHKRLFKMWKDKNINIYNNELCITVMSRKIILIDKCYNLNFYLGEFARKVCFTIPKFLT